MEKIKSFKFLNILNIIKSCLVAILITIVGIIILAFVLKFVDLNSIIISYANDAIKAIALFVMMLFIKKKDDNKLILKALLGGVVYALLCFVIFSIFNGNFILNMGFVYDLLFAIIVAVLASIIINILKRKSY